jgi:hypothetical protein
MMTWSLALVTGLIEITAPEMSYKQPSLLAPNHQRTMEVTE